MKASLAARLPYLSLLVLVLLAAAPLWGPGIVNTRAGGDSPFLLWRTFEMAANLRAGVFPARWMPDAAYGYGYPFFSYYAALPFYLAGLLTVIGADILTAIKLTQTIGFVMAALTMYGWTRRHFPHAGAWLAAVAYTFASFHLVNVYTRGDSLSEFYAFVFFPLILWAIDLALERRDARPVAALALAFGGLFITHNLSALIFAPFVALYLVFRISNLQSPISRLLPCVIGLALGLALSAWCWAPFFFERDFGQLGEQTTGYFNYTNHFRSLDLVQPTLAFDYDVGATTPFAMSAAQAVLAMLGVGVMLGRALRRRRLDALSVFTLIGLAITTYMITPLSKPVWDHVPYLPIVQFPWRFLTVQAVFTALAPGEIAGRTVLAAKHKMLYGIIGLLMAAASMLNLHPDRLYISPSDVTVENLQLYEMFTANIGTTIRYEYLPRGVVPRLYTSDALIEPGQPMRAVALGGEAAALRVSAAPIRQTWHVTSPAGATVAFPILWWPGWEVTVDGKPAPIGPAVSSGRIAVEVPRGEHEIALSLGRTPLRAAAEGVSLVALMAVLVLWLRPRLRRRAAGTTGAPPPSAHAGSRRAVLDRTDVLAVVGVSLLALTFYAARSRPITRYDDETMDFVAQPYLHHTLNGAPLGRDASLINYDVRAGQAQTGQVVNVRLGWLNRGPAQTVTVTLVSPAQHMVGLESAPAFAQSVAEIANVPAPQTTHSLTLPPDMPTGIYLLKAQVGQDEIYLRPVRVQNERPVGDAPVLAQFGDRIRLHRVRAEQMTPTQLAVALDWSTTQPIEANYAIAVRLRGVASIDTQPGYGFLPTSLWRPGELISDRYTLTLPEGTPPRSNQEIEVILYNGATLAGIGQYIQPNVALTQYARRPVDSPALARFSELALATLNIPPTHQQGAPALNIQAGWLTTAPQSADRAARWTIYDSTNTPVFTQTLDLVAGIPSSVWPSGAFVTGDYTLNIPATLEPGQYHLSVTVLNRTTRAEESLYLAPLTFEIVGHPRSFAVPPMQHRSAVKFGDQVALLGYDFKSPTSTRSVQSPIELTLYWQAIARPQADYKIFVHLFDPANEQIAAQHDAMPLNGQYPTSWWTAGQVVSETVTLDLRGVQPGAYRLAAGLYDARTVTRLPAFNPSGERLDADRVVLPERITVAQK
jgi:hypothetical protein